MQREYKPCEICGGTCRAGSHRIFSFFLIFLFCFKQFELDFSTEYPNALAYYEENWERVKRKITEILKKEVVTKKPELVNKLTELDVLEGV